METECNYIINNIHDFKSYPCWYRYYAPDMVGKISTFRLPAITKEIELIKGPNKGI